MPDVKHIHISDYDYPLPDGRIAKYPLARRDSSKLLVYDHGELSEDTFSNIARHLPNGALMVLNNTKVIQARIHFRRTTGALIEVFLLEPALPADYEQMFQSTCRCQWLCMIGNLKKWKDGPLQRQVGSGGRQTTLKATRIESRGTSFLVEFTWDNADILWSEMLDRVGELPIPPYLNRATEESDKVTYQTVYSKIDGSVAAPTAGLHFTPEVLSSLAHAGIDREELTLHVGAGTFRPVKSEEMEGHEMHTEHIAVTRQTVEKLVRHGGKAIAVGTTSVRTLESLYYMGLRLRDNPSLAEEELHVSQWEPYEVEATLTTVEAMRELLAWFDRNGVATLHTSTQIMIAPGYEYKVVNMLVTNFHQPRSTLLLLVAAFLKGDWRRVYDYALAHDFRFLSYGDSNLMIM